MENAMTHIDNETGLLWACGPQVNAWSAGVIHGNDPTKFPVPLLLLQMSTASLFSALFQVILKPFGHFHFVPQMLSGILLGPSVFGRSKYYISKFFYTRSLYMIESYDPICILFMSFLTSAHIDVGMVKKGGKLALINGLMLYIFPVTAGFSTCYVILKKTNRMSPSLQKVIYKLPTAESCLFFQMVYDVLSDLKMLNSELGRLALSSVMVCNCFGWAGFVIVASLKSSLRARDLKIMVASQSSMILLLFAMVFVCRPIMKWMMKRTPEGRRLKHSYLSTICVMLLLCAFLSESTGLSFFVGAIALGLATPSKPPLGPGLSDKIGCFIQAVLMPCYVVGIGKWVDISSICSEDMMIIELVIVVIQSVKFLSIALPSLYFKVPISHAVTLGFIVNIQGIYDIQIYKQALTYKGIPVEVYSIMVIFAVVHSMIHTIVVRRISKGTNKYVAYQRRTVRRLRPESRLNILTSFHKLESVHSILSILELSCPTRESPISILALYLKEIEHQSMPALVQHQLDQTLSYRPNWRDRFVKAFRNFEAQNQGTVSVECFTTVAPYTTMHDDVYSLALDKGTELVIVTLDKDDGTPVRRMCRNILENAPCPVGILFDRGRLPDFRSLLAKHMKINVCVVFLGGADDREALAFGTRMANHPNVILHVLRLVNDIDSTAFGNLIEKKLDQRAINRFRMWTVDRKNVEFREMRIEEATELMELLKEDGDGYTLIIVGIEHDEDSAVLDGLWDWSEMKELGVIGDLLASADLGLSASVMAVQQQALVVEKTIENSW